jgi:hypothetical protein
MCGYQRPVVAMLVGLAPCTPTARAAPEQAAAASVVESVTPPIEGFYGKRLRYGRIPILGHATVTDEGMLAARDRLDRMLAHAPKVRENLEGQGHELHVIALRQFASDLPELRAHRNDVLAIVPGRQELFDWHMIGGHLAGRMSSCSEGTLLPIVGHRLFGDETCFHELGHAIEILGLDGPSRARVVAAFERSIAGGHWRDPFVSTRHAEWFAEITKFYFRPDRPDLSHYDQNLVRGRAWLAGEDPNAFRLADDLYSGRVDPGTARTVELRLGPGHDEAALRSKESRVPTLLTVVNRTSIEIRLVWVDFEGRRDAQVRPSAGSGGMLQELSWATHAFILADPSGRALCTLTLGDDNATADFRGPCD